DNVDRCDLVLILTRGRVAFFGPPERALGYFGVTRLGLIYDALEGPHAHKSPEEWEQQFQAADEWKEYVQGRLAKEAPPPQEAAAGRAVVPPAPPAGAATLVGGTLLMRGGGPKLADHFRQVSGPPLKAREWLRSLADQWRQFWVLTRRYLELTWSDRR